MFTSKDPVKLENVYQGQVIEKGNQLLEEAIKNCLDLSYDDSPRKIKITLRLKPNVRRDEIAFLPEFEIQKGKIRMASIGMAIGINQAGRPEAREYVDRQQALFNQGVIPIDSKTAGAGEGRE